MSGHGELQDREVRWTVVMHPQDGDLKAATVVAIVVATESSSNK